MNRPPRQARAQRGVTILVVLVLLTVVLLGGLSLARMTEVGTLVAGNLAGKERAVQASEVGLNNAFAAVQALANEEANSGGWYYATQLAQTAEGLPNGITWSTVPAVTPAPSSGHTVRFVVERVCDGALPIVNLEQQCLVKAGTSIHSENVGSQQYQPVTGRQFRVTVRVDGPKGAATFVQALVTG